MGNKMQEDEDGRHRLAKEQARKDRVFEKEITKTVQLIQIYAMLNRNMRMLSKRPKCKW